MGAEKMPNADRAQKLAILEGVKDEVARVMVDRRRSSYEKSRAIGGYIVRKEHEIGSFFVHAKDGNIYHFDALEQKLRRILDGKSIHPSFGALLCSRYSLMYTERVTRAVVTVLETAATENPNRPAVKRFTSFDTETNMLYVSRYDGTMYKLDGESITIVPNGQGALFLDDDNGVHVEANIGDHKILHKTLIDDLNYSATTASGYSPEHQKMFLHAWLYAAAFNEKLVTKPLLTIIAEFGGGKTFAIKRIQYALRGVGRPIMLPSNGSDEDFFVAILREPIALIDNIDSYVDWLPNTLAAYATGGSQARRKRYTDDVAFDLRPQSFIAMTSRNPVSLYREDIADRLLILRLDRRAGFHAELPILTKIEEQRSKLFGEWLYNLNRIVADLKNTAENTDIAEIWRLADCERFFRKIGQVLEYSNEFIDAALVAQNEERKEFSTENEPLIDLIEQWLIKYPAQEGQFQSAADLYAKLSLFSEDSRIKWSFKSPAALGTFLSNKWAGISRRLVADRRLEPRKTLYMFAKPAQL